MAERESAGGDTAGSASGGPEFTLKDRRPPELNGLQIGTPINADTNSIMWHVNAFLPGELKRRGLLIPDRSSRWTQTWVGAHDSKWQYTSGWNASGKLELNAGIIDIAAKAYAKQTEDECNRSSNAAVVGVSEYRYSFSLEEKRYEAYFCCTTEHFRTLVDEVKTKADAAETSQSSEDFAALLACLDTFYETYGTGFVSGLDLVSYGVYEAVLSSGSKAVDELFKIGGGIAAAVPFVIGEGEAEYLRTHMEHNVHMSFSANSFGQPLYSPPERWAFNAAGALNAHSLEEFLKDGAWTNPASHPIEDPKNPDITPQRIDLSKLLDFPQLPGIFGDIVEIFKHNILGLPASAPTQHSAPQAAARGASALMADAQTEEKPNTSTVKAEIRAREEQLKTFARFTQEKINQEAKLDGHPTAYTSFQRSDKNAGGDGGDEIASPGGPIRRNASPGGADGNASPGGGDTADNDATLNLEGWVPEGYRYLAWEEIFPQLKIHPALTESQLVFGQSLEWLSMRRMFAEYLEFCSDFDGVVRDEGEDVVPIASQAETFRSVLDQVGSDLTDQLMGKDKYALTLVDANTGLNFLQILEQDLKEGLDNADFRLYEHYQFWIDNFEWLKRIPFGVVAVVNHDGGYAYQSNPYPGCPIISGVPEGFTWVKRRPSATELIGADVNAYRLYPIISTTPKTKGKPRTPCFAWVGAPSQLHGGYDDEVLRRSGLLSLRYRKPEESPEGPATQPENWEFPQNLPPRLHDDKAEFRQTVVPMLIHQSPEGAAELLSAEKDLAEFEGSAYEPGGPNIRTGSEALQERWDNRTKMFGLHLYPGVGADTGFGPTQRLLQVAGTLAQKATRHATVLPKKHPEAPDQTHDENDRYGKIWDVEGVCAAYSPTHKTMFFWGPAEGPECPDTFDDSLPVQFVPVGYKDADIAVKAFLRNKKVKIPNEPADPKEPTEPISLPPEIAKDWAMNAGGGPMWSRPETDLFRRLWNLAGQKPKPPPVDF